MQMPVEEFWKAKQKNQILNVSSEIKLISGAFDENENYWLPLFIDTLLISSTWICFNISFCLEYWLQASTEMAVQHAVSSELGRWITVN